MKRLLRMWRSKPSYILMGCNCQNLETPKISFNRWIDKQIVVHPLNGILFSNKNKWAIKPWKIHNEPKIQITQWKKPVWKVYVYYDSNYMTLWKWKAKWSVVVRSLGTREEGWVGEAQGIFRRWTYSVCYYNARYLKPCICQNPQNFTAKSKL